MLFKATINTYQDKKQSGVYIAFVDSYAKMRYSDSLVYMSFTMTERAAQSFQSAFRRHDKCVVDVDYYDLRFDVSNAKIESQRCGEYCNMLLQYRQDEQSREADRTFALFEDFAPDDFDTVYGENKIPKKLVEEVADCIMSYTATPFIKEWAPYVTRELVLRRAFEYADVRGDYEKRGFKSLLIFSMVGSEISDILKYGLQHGKITIDGCNRVSERFKEASKGISSYLAKFGQELADHTTAAFHPAFNPKTEEVSRSVNDFFDVCEYFDGKTKKYVVQKNILEAAKRHLKKHNNFLLAGQTGVGKTLMGIGIAESSAWRKDYSAIVMAPPQMVGDWKREVENRLPLSEVVAVRTLPEFLRAAKELDNPLRTRSLWIVMSYNVLKTTYTEHPAVVWSDAVKGYVCPHCGRPIAVNKTTLDNGVTQTTAFVNATAEDFLKEPDETKKKDMRCCTYVFDENGNVCDDKGTPNGCGDKLWTASTRENSAGGCRSELWGRKDDADDAWIKIPDLGWIQKGRIKDFKESVQFRIDNFDADSRNSRRFKELKRWQKAISTYETRGAVMQYPKRYSIAKYIRKHLNKRFDFAIFDEVHNLEGDSQQGYAFGNVTNAVKKSIFLTGTLSSGYAAGLFHILFRTQTRKMIESGFNYDSEEAFQKKYGVEESTIRTTGRLNQAKRLENTRRRTTTKAKPGISPTIVADFLMDNMVNVTKRDISDNLCPYTEIPLGIEPDGETKDAYRRIVERIANYVATNGRYRQNGFRRRIKNALNTADMFLDQPFGLDTADSEGFGLIELSPDTVRPKEQKLIDLALEKKEAGEKMLVYVYWTNKTDIPNRLCRLLTEHDVSACVMSSKVKPAERSAWLEQRAEEGNDVVIMHPKLVGEGLNLLDYTTIVFYEVGSNLTIVRQASQRSNRINQEDPVSVYFMYYEGTVQEDSLALISQKLKASKSVEGDYTSSALQDMTEDTDILTKLVNSIVKDEHIKVDESSFKGEETPEEEAEKTDEKLVEDEAAVRFSRATFLPEDLSEESVEYLSMCA